MLSKQNKRNFNMDNLLPKPKKVKNSSKEELLKLEKEVLIEKILQLEAHRTQLKNIISKNITDVNVRHFVKQNRPFDFSKCHQRRVLLHVLYFGWNYQGLVVQEDTTETIEDHLFKALIKSCLIQSRETSQYHRSGRTDKGVSAFGQVISITLRSKYQTDEQDLPGSITSEMPYCKILNRLLPKDIRVVSWMPIPTDKPEFSARFDCKKRTYKYYFPRSNLDISGMKNACAFFSGSRDFRNLCKMDVGNGVTSFIREIISADIVPADVNDSNNSTSMYCLRIEGNAFLWHQIRCIMAVLFLVGQGKERPDVITDLLDVDKHPRKPQYNMALDIPLNLFHCAYEIEDTRDWVYDKDELRSVIVELQKYWTLHNVKSTMIKDTLVQLESKYAKVLCASEMEERLGDESERDKVMAHTDCLLQGVKPRNYTPLFKRGTCSSLEEKIEYYKKKRKIKGIQEDGE